MVPWWSISLYLTLLSNAYIYNTFFLILSFHCSCFLIIFAGFKAMLYCDHAPVTVIRLPQPCRQFCLQLPPRFFMVRDWHNHIEDQIDLLFSLDHAEVMDTAAAVQSFQRPVHLHAYFHDFFILRFDRIHMDNQENTQCFYGLSLDPVNDFVGLFDVDIVGDFCMRCV